MIGVQLAVTWSVPWIRQKCQMGHWACCPPAGLSAKAYMAKETSSLRLAEPNMWVYPSSLQRPLCPYVPSNSSPTMLHSSLRAYLTPKQSSTILGNERPEPLTEVPESDSWATGLDWELLPRATQSQGPMFSFQDLSGNFGIKMFANEPVQQKWIRRNPDTLRTPGEWKDPSHSQLTVLGQHLPHTRAEPSTSGRHCH